MWLISVECTSPQRVPYNLLHPIADTELGLAVPQGSIVQALQSDFGKVQELVEEAVRQLSSRGGASSVAPLDACGIMEVMNESHVSQLLPRCTEGDAVLERFRQHCLDCKVRHKSGITSLIARRTTSFNNTSSLVQEVTVSATT